MSAVFRLTIKSLLLGELYYIDFSPLSFVFSFIELFRDGRREQGEEREIKRARRGNLNNSVKA